jgi:bifunctional DNase/RNase
LEKLVSLSVVSLSPSNLGSNSYILLLKSNEDNTSVFPIVIGPNEAQAISVFLENIEMPRPLTHQLTLNILQKSQVEVEKVVISDFKEGIFYSTITLNSEKGSFEVDARPSDGIALAIKKGQPILIKEELLNEICISTEEAESTDEFEDAAENQPKSLPKSLNDVDQLKEKLKEALDMEDYETAAKIRDQINTLTNK